MRNLIPVNARAGIVVTGTEVLTGRVQDRNGPWIADRLLELGVELAHITICGDRSSDIEAQLQFLADQQVDLIVTSGGLGPTADDMTVEIVARFCGRQLVLDGELEAKIAAILDKLRSAFTNRDMDSVRAANRKQAMVPAGAHVIDPVGTAATDVAHSCRNRSGAGGDRRPYYLPAGHRADVRSAGVGPGRDAAGCAAADSRLSSTGDHHLPAARRSGNGHPV
jgi:molybdenum cofactor synthesis domain-containing protein